jgi:Zinc knuckle
MVVVIDTTPIEYQSCLLNEQQNSVNLVSLDNLQEVMEALHFQLFTVKMGKNNDGGTKISLSGIPGTCFMCKRKGHMASECPTTIVNKGNE